MRNIFVICFALSLLVVSCKNTNTQEKKSPENIKKFEMVSIPSFVTSPEERGMFLVTHYWDNFDFSDTSYISLPEVTEQAFSNYIEILPVVPPATVKTSITSMLDKASISDTMFSYFAGLYEKYLYDPSSPLRNDELYIPVLEYLIASNKINSEEKIRPAHQLETVSKNRTGKPAADFSITTADGRVLNIHSVRAKYTLLFFNNPGCKLCGETIGYISESPVFAAALRDGELKIVAVYPDEDITAWKENLSKFPTEWINGYDAGQIINKTKLYDLRSIPSLYLLDSNKNVILKNADFGPAEAVLAQLRQGSAQ